MGCDLHLIAQVRKNGHWETMEKRFDEPRNYFLFHVMAGVRSEPEWSDVEPISEPRGIPNHVKIDPLDEEFVFLPSGEHVWLGDHGYSWFTVAEFQEYMKTFPALIKRSGCITAAQYLRLKEHGEKPNSWSKLVGGRDVMTVADKNFEDARHFISNPNVKLYVRATWEEESADWMSWLEDTCSELIKETELPPTEIRLVFGFDS